MFAVIGRGLYADVDPKRFGNLGSAMFTLFQLLTLDDWFYIYSDAVAKDPSYFHIIFFLVFYIAFEYFIFLNLFVAVLVDNFQLTLEAAAEKEAERKEAMIVQTEFAVKCKLAPSFFPIRVILQITMCCLQGHPNKKLEEEDHDEDNHVPRQSVVETVSSEELFKTKKTFDDYYAQGSDSDSDKQYLAHCFQLLASLDYNGNLARNQQGTLDKIVEVVQETTDDA